MGNKIKKALFFILIFGISASLLFPQSLVELAKKEKERRASIRAGRKHRIVVTNEDLRKFEIGAQISPFETVLIQLSPVLQAQRSIPPPKIKVSVEPQLRHSDRSYGVSRYATKILPSTSLVKRSEAALAGPNGQYAEISLFGVLDIEVNVKNGPGDDIAVYARLEGMEETRRVSQGGGFPLDFTAFGYIEGFWYGVLCVTDKGEWALLGRGTGTGSPETFDLGDVSSTKRIRIMFKPHTNADLPFRYRRLQPGEFTFGIDAVEILH